MATPHLHVHWNLGIAAALVLCCGLACPDRLLAEQGWQMDQPIVVELRDGRRIQGDVDRRSNTDELWLRSELNGAQIASRYFWSDINKVWQSGQAIELQRLHADVQALPPRTAQGLAQTEWEQPLLLTAETAADRNTVLLPQIAAAFPEVRSLHIEARLANWDADAPADGLLVTVYPLSSTGEWMPVRGNLDLTLLGEVWPGSEEPHRYPRAGFHELARASHLVRKVDFARGPATFQLPLRKVHPEAMPSIATYGLVHARLGVSGAGVFEASDSFVRLREPSPTRDRLQLFRGQRFFPAEHPPRLP